MEMTVDESNVLLFKVKNVSNGRKIDINTFIEIFLNEGPFESLMPNLMGCYSLNFNHQIFSVSFNQETKQEFLNHLVHSYKEPPNIQISNDTVLQVRIQRPPKLQTMVTLYPIPHNIRTEQVTTLTKDWGNYQFHRFGRHKRCPMLMSGYLHIYLTKIQKAKIPDTIKVNHRFVAVFIKGEEISRCGYCKEKNHDLDFCPYRPRAKLTSLEAPVNFDSYSSGVQTIYNKPIIQHKSYQPSPRPISLNTATSSEPLFSSDDSSYSSSLETPEKKILSNLTTPEVTPPQSPSFSSTHSPDISPDSTPFKTANKWATILPIRNYEPPLFFDESDFPTLSDPQNRQFHKNGKLITKRKKTILSSLSSEEENKKPIIDSNPSNNHV